MKWRNRTELLCLLSLTLTALILWTQYINRHIPVFQFTEHPVPVTIIMYHSVVENPAKSGPYVITPKQLEQDIAYLDSLGCSFVTVTDLIRYVYLDWETLPDKAVMITFDDGHYNSLTHVLPIMEKYNASFVVSVVGKLTENAEEEERPNPDYSYLSWDHIRALDASGLVEIQNHSYDLHDTGRRFGSMKKKGESVESYQELLREDLMKLQLLMKEHTGIIPNTFTYPFGGISKESVDVLKELGFLAALSCREDINYMEKGNTDQLLHLNRYNRPSGPASTQYFSSRLAFLK